MSSSLQLSGCEQALPTVLHMMAETGVHLDPRRRAGVACSAALMLILLVLHQWILIQAIAAFHVRSLVADVGVLSSIDLIFSSVHSP